MSMPYTGEVNSRLPSDSSVQASESVTVFSWEDPSFWKMDSSCIASITTPTSSSASSGTLTSNKKVQSPDQKPSPTTMVGDTGKISKLIASHGVFKMDNPLSKASTPRNNSRRLRDLAPLSSRKNSDAQEPILKSSSGETESTPPSNYTNHTIR